MHLYESSAGSWTELGNYGIDKRCSTSICDHFFYIYILKSAWLAFISFVIHISEIVVLAYGCQEWIWSWNKTVGSIIVLNLSPVV